MFHLMHLARIALILIIVVVVANFDVQPTIVGLSRLAQHSLVVAAITIAGSPLQYRIFPHCYCRVRITSLTIIQPTSLISIVPASASRASVTQL